jgi:MFS family permease
VRVLAPPSGFPHSTIRRTRTALAVADLASLTPPRRAHWYTFAVVLAYEFACGVDMGQTTVLVKPIEQYYAIGDTAFATIAVSSCYFGRVFVYFVGGILADGYNRRNLLVASCFLWAVTAAAIIFAAHPWQLFTLRLLGGFAMSIGGASIFHVLVDSFSRDLRMLAMTLFGVGYAIGFGAAISLSGYVFAFAQRIGPQDWPLAGHVVPWQLCFLFVAALGVVAGLMLLTLREPSRMDARFGEPQRNFVASLRTFAWYLRRHGVLWVMFLLSNAFALSVYAGVTTFEPTLMSRVYQVPIGAAATLLGTLTSATLMGSRIAGGALVQWFINRGKGMLLPYIYPCFTGVAVVFAIAFPLAPSYAISVVLMTAAIFFVNAVGAFQVAAIQDTVPNEVRGQIVGIGGFFDFVSFALGSVVLAFVSDRFFGGGPGLRYAFALVGGIATLAGTIGLWLCIQPYLAARRELEAAVAARL